MKRSNDNQIYGLHPVMEGLLSGTTFDKIFLQQDLKSEQLKELKSLAKKMGVTVVNAPREKLNRLCRKNHQGVVAFTSPIEFAVLEEIIQSVFEQGETPHFIMLDKVSDVRNFGSIARSAVSAGCHGIIVPHKGAAAINEESLKSSAGALFHIPVCKVYSLGDAIKLLRTSGIPTIACTEKADHFIYEEDLSGPVNLLMGNEGEGIDPHLLRMSNASASIPMRGKIDSLNVAVASSLIMYEVVRQRLKA